MKIKKILALTAGLYAFVGLALGLFMLISVIPVLAVKPDKPTCATIQDGTILDVKGNPITTDYDAWGYNYQAHMFNGFYWNNSRPDVPWTYESLIAAGKSTTWLIMKWNDAWLSNKDCDDDNLLDRHYGFPTYSGSGAWLTNHQWGDGWNYFVKIVSAPADADVQDGSWYTADDEEIGSVIWGAHARILQISNDPAYDEHGVLNKWETPAGFGFYKP